MIVYGLFIGGQLKYYFCIIMWVLGFEWIVLSLNIVLYMFCCVVEFWKYVFELKLCCEFIFVKLICFIVV